MRVLRGSEDLQLAKEVLIAFENQHHAAGSVCSDIEEGLYWDEESQCYSADLGMILRGEADEVRIFVADDEWLDFDRSRPVAFINYKGETYFLTLRF